MSKGNSCRLACVLVDFFAAVETCLKLNVSLNTVDKYSCMKHFMVHVILSCTVVWFSAMIGSESGSYMFGSVTEGWRPLETR